MSRPLTLFLIALSTQNIWAQEQRGVSDLVVMEAAQRGNFSRQDFRGVSLEVGPVVTSDSRILLIVRYPETATQLVVETIFKGSQPSRSKVARFSLPEGGLFTPTIFLPRGPGAYQLKIFLKTADSTLGRLYFRQAVTNNDTRDLRFLLPSSMIQSSHEEIITLAESITAKATTTRNKSYAIYQWVARNVAYDTDSRFASAYMQEGYDFSALAVLQSSKDEKQLKAMCAGFATFTVALHRAIGIPARMVSGFSPRPTWTDYVDPRPFGSPNHAWTEALIDGRWVSMDTTFAAGGVNHKTKKFVRNARIPNQYFDPNPRKFFERHRPARYEDY